MGALNALNIPSAVLRKHHVVYALTLVKEGQKSRLGIGSAAHTTDGALRRIKDYQDDMTWNFSVFTRKSLEDGFDLTNVGILAMIKLPARVLRPRARAFSLTLEASFTWRFWTPWQAADKDRNQHYMRQACPWKIEDLEWKGLNTHSPLSEDVNSIELSTEEMAAVLALRHEKTKASRRKYNKSPKGRAAAKRARTTGKKKETDRRIQKRKRTLKTPTYVAMRKRESDKMKQDRKILKDFENNVIIMDESVRQAVGRARKEKARAQKSQEKGKEKRSKAQKESRLARKKVLNGELDGNDPKVKELIKFAERENRNAAAKRARKATKKEVQKETA